MGGGGMDARVARLLASLEAEHEGVRQEGVRQEGVRHDEELPLSAGAVESAQRGSAGVLQAEPGRAEPGRAEPGRAEPGRGQPGEGVRMETEEEEEDPSWAEWIFANWALGFVLAAAIAAAVLLQ